MDGWIMYGNTILREKQVRGNQDGELEHMTSMHAPQRTNTAIRVDRGYAEHGKDGQTSGGEGPASWILLGHVALNQARTSR